MLPSIQISGVAQRFKGSLHRRLTRLDFITLAWAIAAIGLFDWHPIPKAAIAFVAPLVLASALYLGGEITAPRRKSVFAYALASSVL
jgi:hypothetical protein